MGLATHHLQEEQVDPDQVVAAIRSAIGVSETMPSSRFTFLILRVLSGIMSKTVSIRAGCLLLALT